MHLAVAVVPAARPKAAALSVPAGVTTAIRMLMPCVADSSAHLSSRRRTDADTALLFAVFTWLTAADSPTCFACRSAWASTRGRLAVYRARLTRYWNAANASTLSCRSGSSLPAG